MLAIKMWPLLGADVVDVARKSTQQRVAATRKVNTQSMKTTTTATNKLITTTT